ncbi:hypothetical protein ACWKW9_18270, partial [Rhizobium daejeonense]
RAPLEALRHSCRKRTGFPKKQGARIRRAPWIVSIDVEVEILRSDGFVGGLPSCFNVERDGPVVNKSGCHFLGLVSPQAKCISPSMTV